MQLFHRWISSAISVLQIENSHNILMGVWTQILFKHIECCNFQTVTVMYLKVYISGMEMSQRIHFWLNFTKNDGFFEKMAKEHFLVKIFCIYLYRFLNIFYMIKVTI